MTNGQRTVTTLLAVVAVLLGLNLILSGSPRAVAQEPEIRIFPEPPVRITHIAASTDSRTAVRKNLFRLWSDGVIEANSFVKPESGPEVWTGWEVVPDVPAP